MIHASTAGPAQAEPVDVQGLVRPDAVNRRVYTDPGIFALEMERLFARAWVYVGHESQAAAPGDWFVTAAGPASLVVARGEDGEVRAFYNRCSHRGVKLCSLRAGHGERLVCPYHGWSYDLEGELVSVPLGAGYPASFRKEDNGLPPVEKLELYRGFIFVRLGAEGPELLDFLGHMRTSIDDLVDRSPTGRLTASPVVLKHSYRANWKFTFENLNDTIHAGFAHHASVVASAKVKGALGDAPVSPSLNMMLANGKSLQAFQETPMATEAFGHSYIGGHIRAGYSAPAASAYAQALAAHHGEEKAAEVLSVDRHLTLMYPSSTWHARYQTVRMIRPVAVDLTEVWGFVFRLEGAPEETFVNAIEYINGSTSGFSPVIADDLEIYERIQTGGGAGEEWLPYSRGQDERFGGAAPDGDEARSPSTSEVFIRNQFAAWSRLMAEAA